MVYGDRNCGIDSFDVQPSKIKIVSYFKKCEWTLCTVKEGSTDADQRNFVKNGPRRTTDQENFITADRRGPWIPAVKFKLNMRLKGTQN